MHNILFITTDSRLGGTEKSIVCLLNALDRDRYRPFMSVLKDGGRLSDMYKSKVTCFHESSISSDGIRLYFSSLKKFIAEHDIQIVHSFLFHANMVARMLKRAYPRLVCINSHRTMERHRTWHLWIDRWTKRYVDYEIANAEAVKRFIIQKTGSDPARIAAIYNGYAAPPVLSRKKDLRSTLTIGCIGNFTKPKNQFVLIRELTALLRATDSKLIFAGNGPLRDQCERYVRSQNLETSVEFHNATDAVEAIYSRIDVLVIPSRWEGLPNVLCEALLRTIPVVSKDVGGVKELRSFTTALFLYDTQTELYSHLEKIRSEYSAIVSGLSKDAVVIAAEFSTSKMSEAHQSLYQRVIDQFFPNILNKYN